MYQVFCLKGTPPETYAEQEKCFRSKTRCWRLAKQSEQQEADEVTSASQGLSS